MKLSHFKKTDFFYLKTANFSNFAYAYDFFQHEFVHVHDDSLIAGQTCSADHHDEFTRSPRDLHGMPGYRKEAPHRGNAGKERFTERRGCVVLTWVRTRAGQTRQWC